MAIAFTWPEGKSKALAISYDDGCRQDAEIVRILNRFGIKGTFHLNSGLADDSPSKLSLAESCAVYAGHEISCHTLTHPYLERIPHSEIMREVWLDRQNLEKITGRQVRGMSYPMRNYTKETIDICRAAGILYARTAESTGKFNLPSDFMQWAPTCHQSEALAFLEKFTELESWRKLSLFMVWGHGFEFERETSGVSWEMLETFCRRVADDKNVWSATCMEICRYVNAVRNAEISCDGRNIFNPTGQTLYFVNGDGIATVGPGEEFLFN